jgi:hypothetical protein
MTAPVAGSLLFRVQVRCNADWTLQVMASMTIEIRHRSVSSSSIWNPGLANWPIWSRIESSQSF